MKKIGGWKPILKVGKLDADFEKSWKLEASLEKSCKFEIEFDKTWKVGIFFRKTWKCDVELSYGEMGGLKRKVNYISR